MAQDLPINKRLVIPAGELQWRFSRSSGPGGQGVNTTDSRVELVLDLAASTVLGPFQKQRLLKRFEQRLVNGCLSVVAAEQRSQWQNRQQALSRLADLLREGLQPPPPARRTTKPSRGAVKRRLQAKKQRGVLKQRRRDKPSLES